MLDQDLTTKDLSIAIPRFVEAIMAANWPSQQIEMLKSFWEQLMTHDYRYSDDPIDVQTIIHYQAEQRSAWHNAIANVGGAWNIGIINNEVLRDTREKVYHTHRVRAEVAQRAKVSLQSPSLSPSHFPCALGHRASTASQRPLEASRPNRFSAILGGITSSRALLSVSPRNHYLYLALYRTVADHLW